MSESSATPMTFREMNLRVFQRRPIPHLLFQPRFEPWYAWHKEFGRLPERYAQARLVDLLDDLGCSMRYIHYYTDMPDPIVVRYSSKVKIREEGGETRRRHIAETPYGELISHYQLTVDRTWRQVVHPARTLDDLRAVTWLHRETEVTFSPERFEQGAANQGDRGEPQFWVPKSPYFALGQFWMTLPDLIYALADAPAVVEETMDAIDRSYDTLYEQLTAYASAKPGPGGLHIINFGENMHEAYLSPRHLERYMLPWYDKRVDQLHSGGIFSHMHLDGFFKGLLTYLTRMPFDGLEALTPTPQGDVELEELAEHIGDKIVLDGIPAVLFVAPYTRDDLMSFTERLVELLSPNLVLGISDELPEGSPEEGLERVRMVADWCRRQTR